MLQCCLTFTATWEFGKGDAMSDRNQVKCLRCGVFKQRQPYQYAPHTYGCHSNKTHVFSDGTTSAGGRWYTCPDPGTVVIAGEDIKAGEMVCLRTRRPKVYVAAPYSEARRVQPIHKMIRDAGGVITSLWAEQAKGPNDDFSSRAVIERAISENDLGVEAADLVLALGFEGKGRAMFGEIRLAIDRGIPVFYHGPLYLDVQRKGVKRFETRGLAIDRTIEAVKNAVASGTERVYSAGHAPEHTQPTNPR